MNKPLVFLTGAAIGAVGALMLSPNSGERNREILADKVDYYTAQGEQVFQQTADSVIGKVRGAAEPANVSSDDIREKINEARDRIAEQIARNSAQDVDAQVADVTEAAKEAAADVAADAADDDKGDK